MSDSVDDQGFKLFGRKIPVSETPQIWDSSGDAAADKPDSVSHPNYSQLFIDVSRETEKSDNDDLQMEEICETDKSLGMDHEKDQDKDETPTPKDDIPNTDPNLKEEKVETNTSDQEKVVKKPDKILPCPRCNSFDTKFCYYNNYNVNQPRHFCKKCQRYWTAGGTMRNVPVGAGRRKNKHMASHYRHMIIPSNGTPTTQISTLDMVNHPARSCQGFPALSRPSKGSGPVLEVRPDAPLCQSMASALDLEDHKRRVEMGQMVHGDHEEQPSSCGSSAIASISCENEVPSVKQCSAPGFCDRATPPNPLHCYPVPPWFYPWDSGWNNLAATPAGQSSDELVFGPGNGRTELMQSSPKSIVAAPSFCAPIMPYPFVPASYWGFVPSWASNPWNIPWVGSNGSISQASSSSNSGCSSHGSPSLGKHSRDRNPLGEDTSEKSLWIPKTLRIDDPDEAAKSSIWATLGIKPEQNEQKRKVGPFRAFQPKTEGDYLASDTAKFLQANPAAFSRSQAFQETS